MYVTIVHIQVQRSSRHLPCVAVFPDFSMANHSCLSTAKYAVAHRESSGFRMELRTKGALGRDRELTICYLDPLTTTAARQAATQTRWGFSCRCPRCRDPTELGTGASGVRCGMRLAVLKKG